MLYHSRFTPLSHKRSRPLTIKSVNLLHSISKRTTYQFSFLPIKYTIEMNSNRKHGVLKQSATPNSANEQRTTTNIRTTVHNNSTLHSSQSDENNPKHNQDYNSDFFFFPSLLNPLSSVLASLATYLRKSSNSLPP